MANELMPHLKTHAIRGNMSQSREVWVPTSGTVADWAVKPCVADSCPVLVLRLPHLQLVAA